MIRRRRVVFAALLVVAAASIVVAIERQTSDAERAPTWHHTAAVTTPSASNTGPTVDRVAPLSVATERVSFLDPSRATPARGSVPAHDGRSFPTVVRWPTVGGSLTPGDHPLVVFAHGYAVDAATYSSLLDLLARAGAIVAAPELPGESSALDGTPNEADLANEPCDLAFVAQSVLRTPPESLRGVTPNESVVYAGHSDGATAAAAAGYQALPCPGPRASGVVALSAQDIDITASSPLPVLLAVTGTADEINPEQNTRRLFAHVPSPAWLLTVDGGSHLGTFTDDPELPAIAEVVGRFVRDRRIATADATDGGKGRLHLSAR